MSMPTIISLLRIGEWALLLTVIERNVGVKIGLLVHAAKSATLDEDSA